MEGDGAVLVRSPGAMVLHFSLWGRKTQGCLAPWTAPSQEPHSIYFRLKKKKNEESTKVVLTVPSRQASASWRPSWKNWPPGCSYLLWSLAWNCFLPDSHLSQLWASRLSPGKCSESTEGKGLSVLKRQTHSQCSSLISAPHVSIRPGVLGPHQCSRQQLAISAGSCNLGSLVCSMRVERGCFLSQMFPHSEGCMRREERRK
jgi:hypothetical protein